MPTQERLKNLINIATRNGQFENFNNLLQQFYETSEALQQAVYDVVQENYSLKSIEFLVEQSIQCLIGQGADINAVDENGDSALHHAVRASQFTTIKGLIKKGANINAANQQKETPLHIALTYRSSHLGSRDLLKTIQYLIEQGANIEAKDNFHCTAVHLSVNSDSKFAIFKFLLQKGANLEAQGHSHYTALHYAVLHNQLQNVQYLLEQGANANALNIHERTALILYLSQYTHGSLEMVRCLTRGGTDIHQKDQHGKTALDYAFYGQNFAITQYLIQEGTPMKMIKIEDTYSMNYYWRAVFLRAYWERLNKSCGYPPAEHVFFSAIIPVKSTFHADIRHKFIYNTRHLSSFRFLCSTLGVSPEAFSTIPGLPGMPSILTLLLSLEPASALFLMSGLLIQHHEIHTSNKTEQECQKEQAWWHHLNQLPPELKFYTILYFVFQSRVKYIAKQSYEVHYPPAAKDCHFFKDPLHLPFSGKDIAVLSEALDNYITQRYKDNQKHSAQGEEIKMPSSTALLHDLLRASRAPISNIEDNVGKTLNSIVSLY